MTQDRPAQPVAGETGQYLSGGGIREMPVTGHDPLLHGPWTPAILLEQFLIVIGLDDHCRRIAKALMDELGREPEIGAEPEASPAMMENEPDGIGGVMRHGKRFNCDIAHGEFRAGHEKPELLAEPLPAGALDGIGGEGVAIDGGLEFLAEDIETRGMIDMLMRDQDGVDGGGIDAGLAKAGADLPGAQAAIDQETALRGLDQGAVSGAPGAEDGHSQHPFINAPKGWGEAMSFRKKYVHSWEDF